MNPPHRVRFTRCAAEFIMRCKTDEQNKVSYECYAHPATGSSFAIQHIAKGNWATEDVEHVQKLLGLSTIEA